MRLFVVRNPRLTLGRYPGTSPDISDALFSFSCDDGGLARYISGCGLDTWADEGHRIHIALEDALKDLCNRCVSFEKQLAGLREKVVADIKEMEGKREEA